MDKILMLMPIVAVLVVFTNIVAEVLKNCFNKLPAQVTVTIIGILLTIFAIIVYCIMSEVPIQWYYIVGGLIGGVCVSYAAMFGYDNLYNKIMEAFKKQE